MSRQHDSAARRAPNRDYPNFAFIRLLAAASVIFSHAFLIADGDDRNEPFVHLLGPGNILGLYGVQVFFIVSGFLVTRSALASRSVAEFAAKRALRIYPALIACAVLCALAVGPLFTTIGVDAYFERLIPFEYAGRTLLNPGAGAVIQTVRFNPGTDDLGRVINGSLWTIAEELKCYVALGLLMWAGLLRPSILGWLGMGALVLSFTPLADSPLARIVPYAFPCFVFGALVSFVEDRAPLRGDIALASIAVAVLAAWAGLLLPLFAVCGTHPVLWLATTTRVRLPSLRSVGDVSYGMYLYGWPVEQLTRTALGDGATWWGVLALSLPLSAGMGYVSWHLLEKHVLAYKRRARGEPRLGPKTSDGAAPI